MVKLKYYFKYFSTVALVLLGVNSLQAEEASNKEKSSLLKITQKNHEVLKSITELSNLDTKTCENSIKAANTSCIEQAAKHSANFIIGAKKIDTGQSARESSEDSVDNNSSAVYLTADLAVSCKNAGKKVKKKCNFKKQVKRVVSDVCGSNGSNCSNLQGIMKNYNLFYDLNLKDNIYLSRARDSGATALQSAKAAWKAKSIVEKVAVVGLAAGAATVTYGLLDHNPKGDKGDTDEAIATSGDGTAVDTDGDGIAETTFSDTCNTSEQNSHLNPACETLYISKCGGVSGDACSSFFNHYCGEGAKGDGSNYCTFQASITYCQSGSSGSPACSWLRNQDVQTCAVNLLDPTCLPPAGSSISLNEFNSSCGYFPEDPLCKSHKAGTLVSKWSVMGESTATQTADANTPESDSSTTANTDSGFTTSSSATRNIAAIDLPKDIIQPSSGINLGKSVVNLYCATGKLADCD